MKPHHSFFSLFLLALTLIACSSDRASHSYGELSESGLSFDGKPILISQDISELKPTPLKARPSWSEMGPITTKAQQEEVTPWAYAVAKELKGIRSREERFVRQADYMCELSAFVDHDFMSSLWMDGEDLKEAFPSLEHSLAQVDVLKGFEAGLLTDIGGGRGAWFASSDYKQVAMHSFLMKHCPAYPKAYDAIYFNKLDKVRGKVDSPHEFTLWNTHHQIGQRAIRMLPDSLRGDVYADLICQLMGKMDFDKGASLAEQMAMVFDEDSAPVVEALRNVRDAEEKLLRLATLRSYGIAFNREQERNFKRKLAEGCPYYHDYVQMKYKLNVEAKATVKTIIDAIN